MAAGECMKRSSQHTAVETVADSARLRMRLHGGVALSLLALLSACSDPKPVVSAPVSVIPAPSSLQRGEGAFIIDGATRIHFGDGVEGQRVAQYFRELVRQTYGINLQAGAGGNVPSSNVIQFEQQSNPAMASESASGPEGYSLISSPQRIVISARDSRGLLYGAVTLWQLLSMQDMNFVVPAVTINDEPRFQWRGLMLDSARHYQPPEFIRKFIDVMTVHKFNTLHWHLTDDQAWRLEIKKYPRLTGIGAWRVPAGPAALADIDAATGKPRLYGGFYSQDEVRDIVAYAAARNITIVPEIDMPGHASAAIAAYPELAVVAQKAPQVPADWGIYRTLFNVEESTFQFFENVLGEVVELFPGEYVHIGGDEAVKDQWQASPRVQERMRELGAKDEHELQSYFIARMGKFLSGKGRRLIGWDEILEGGLPANATVMSWRGIDGAVAAASAGHDTVLSPWPTLYFDNRPLNAPTPPGRGRIVTIEEVYGFDPAPAAIKDEQRKHILGVQANIWVEHIRTPDRIEYMTFPRAAAIAEIGWSPAASKDWPSFAERLPALLERYKLLNVRYAQSTPAPALQANRRSSHELSLCSDKIPLSLEDDAPVTGERAIFMVDIMEPCWLWQQADLSQLDAIVADVGQVPFNFQIGDDVKAIQLRKPATAAGELEVRIDSCAGERIAVMPLAPAVAEYAVTKLPPVMVAPKQGKHDLCFTFTQKSVDPTWVIDSIELRPSSPGASAQ